MLARTRTLLLGITVLAFVVRLVLTLLLRDITVSPSGPPGGDEWHFTQAAQSLGRGDGFRIEGKLSSFRAPGMPFTIAPFYAFLGDRAAPAIYVFLCLCGALACPVTYLLARAVNLSERGGLLAALLTALYIPHAYYSTILVSEAVFIPLLGLGVWLFLRWQVTANLTLLALAALVLGYATLVRPFSLLLLPLFGLFLLFAGKAKGGARLASLVVWPVLFLAVVLPWTWRNHVVHGQFVLMTTNGGSTFYGANNDRVVTEWRNFGGWLATNELPGRPEIDATPDEVSHDKLEWKFGTDWVRANPGGMAKSLVYKTARLVLWLPEFDAVPQHQLVRGAIYLPYLVLFLLGFVACLRSREYWSLPWLVVHGTLLATWATALLFAGQPRFRDANTPLLMCYAVIGLALFAAPSNREV